ncbi:alpha/beta-hydrolase family protein [Demequina sp. B12]|uniref:alpha/beta hydrolase n=1 Tax=Demequina sp. B12 TaxID=2992757 RepID=UPI00237B27DB|nr:alpha/beta-hydrolase family protein [Demequina sp. B12]MDE0573488.1 alpha/beta-hydrolase family protein [Demequina sp. B12]
MSTGPMRRAMTRLTQPHTARPKAPGITQLSFSGVGLVVGLYFFSISLTPSLLPREGWIQGLNSGVTFTVGYAIGVALYAVARFLTVPAARGWVRALLLIVSLGAIALQTGFAVWAYVGWQNDTRASFGLDPLSPWVWPVIVIVATLVAAALLIVGRSIRTLFRWADNIVDRFLPRRLAVAVVAVVLGSLLWWVASGAFVNAFFTVSNWAFSGRDLDTNPGASQPLDTLKSGSPESLMAWEDLGRQGRSFVSTGPTADDIDAAMGGGAREPIRAYVGLRSADTLEERADLLLDELIRADAFDREVLVVATTTGTGYLDPHGVDSLEYLWNGDTAIAGAQYSYLPSWISLLADQEEVEETSRVMFRTIHDYWSTLPDADRPRLYLYGLSLGTTGIEAVLSSIEILNEPIDGALMTGPPFLNEVHFELTRDRDPDSPAALPVFNNGRTVRFANEEGLAPGNGPVWGDTKVVYLQHGSDPVVWFNQHLALAEPAWLAEGERAPDVSPTMEWYPLVTMWQVLLDMPSSGGVPEGYGHLYTATANLHSWAEVTDSPLTDTEREALAAHLEERATLIDDYLNRITG